jgi:pimeloyl-ACP methyl ester carboxylesterase
MLDGRLAEIAAKQAGFLVESPMPRATAFRQIWAASRFKAPVEIQVPSLVLVSRADELVSPECSHRIASRLGSDVREHDRAGHDLTLDDPQWVGSAVARWLEE